MTSENLQLSTASLKRWSELDELGMTAMCGAPMSDEEYEQRLQSVIDGSCFVKYLDKIRAQKLHLQGQLAALSQTEQMLLAKIAESHSMACNWNLVHRTGHQHHGVQPQWFQL